MLTFEDFKELAQKDIPSSEKIGFDENKRSQIIDSKIVEDIITKMLYSTGKTIQNFGNNNILDIGCGCSFFTKYLIGTSHQYNNQLVLIDSQEMLNNLDEDTHMTKVPCEFPNCEEFINNNKNKFDFIIIHSVLHLIYQKNNEEIFYNFINKALELLKDDGVLLLGDLPNISKQKRTQRIDGIDEPLTDSEMDDDVILNIVKKYRDLGYHTTLQMQDVHYPYRAVREDILIFKKTYAQILS